MERVELDPTGTTAGLLKRVLLHETRSPQFGKLYKREDALKAMRLMRQLIYNRIRFQKTMGGPPVRTPLDAVTARNRFASFEDYPTLQRDFMLNVTRMLAIANDAADPRSAANRQQIRDAITAATETNPPGDGVIANVLSWRTEGASSVPDAR